MSKIRQAPAISIHSLVLLVLLAAVHGPVFAQGDSVELPENAHEKSYGGGWECDYGYRELNNETCPSVKVPSNAYLNYPGDGWKCNRGYRAIDEACAAIKVPVNGYLRDSFYGATWKCDRGYLAVKQACVAVVVAKNAHLNSSGNNWDCNRPYRRNQGECALP